MALCDPWRRSAARGSAAEAGGLGWKLRRIWGAGGNLRAAGWLVFEVGWGRGGWIFGQVPKEEGKEFYTVNCYPC